MTARQARRRRKRIEEAADWVLRRRDVGHSAEAEAFAAWLNRAPDNRALYEAAERLMNDAPLAMRADPALAVMSEKRRPVKKAVLGTIAVAIAAAGGASLLLGDAGMRLRADVVAGPSDMPVLTLADGSVMQLNAGSAVAYHFSPAARLVTLLKGEAFFKVAKDAARPFAVEAAGGVTTAHGTAFDVRMGPEGTDVTVTEHAVSIVPRTGAQQAIQVDEGQQAAYGDDGRVQQVEPVDVAAALAWRRGQFVADNVSLGRVVAEIDRHFAGRIVLFGAGDRRVSGTFSVVDTQAALALLQRTFGLAATRIGPLIILRD